MPQFRTNAKAFRLSYFRNDKPMMMMITAHNRCMLNVLRTREWYDYCSSKRCRRHVQHRYQYEAVQAGIGSEFFARTGVSNMIEKYFLQKSVKPQKK